MTDQHPTAALLIIGAEVLSGKVQDENGPHLIRGLRQRGVDVRELRVVDDDIDTIADATNTLRKAVDHLITTGGIGPTHDDVTMMAIAAAFEQKITRHPELVERIQQRYGDQAEGHMRMAEIPQGATLFTGADPMVPVIRLENVIILPGVPSLMRLCFAQVAAELAGAPFFSGALLLNASEGRIAAHLGEVQARMPDVAIGSYPRFDDADWRVKVTVDSRSEEAVKRALEAIRQGLQQEWIVGEL